MKKTSRQGENLARLNAECASQCDVAAPSLMDNNKLSLRMEMPNLCERTLDRAVRGLDNLIRLWPPVRPMLWHLCYDMTKNALVIIRRCVAAPGLAVERASCAARARRGNTRLRYILRDSRRRSGKRETGEQRVDRGFHIKSHQIGALPIEAPPSTNKVWPVTNAASSASRKAIAAAISSGLPSRRIGTAAR